MKPILAVIGGFALSFGMFIAGMVFALYVVIDEPAQAPTAAADITEVWSSEPRTVNKEAQGFERMPAIQAGTAAAAAGNAAQHAVDPAVDPGVDPVTTAALQSEESPVAELLAEEPLAEEQDRVEDRAAARLRAAHDEWCARRYRSYDAGTNSYSPYTGGQRQCMSPYWAQYAGLSGEPAAPADSHERFVPLEIDRQAEERVRPLAENERQAEDEVVVYDNFPVIEPEKRFSIRPPEKRGVIRPPEQRRAIRPPEKRRSGGFNTFDRSGQ